MSEQTRISEDRVRRILDRIEHDGRAAPRDQIEALARDWVDLCAENERLREATGVSYVCAGCGSFAMDAEADMLDNGTTLRCKTCGESTVVTLARGAIG